jgi:hypothetical protein
MGQPRTPGLVIVIAPAETANPRVVDMAPAVSALAKDGQDD